MCCIVYNERCCEMQYVHRQQQHGNLRVFEGVTRIVPTMTSKKGKEISKDYIIRKGCKHLYTV